MVVGPAHDRGLDRPSSLRDRLDRLWQRHGRTFWILHSLWALATGVVVILIAHERYDFVPWVVGFLGLTWLTTLYFGRRANVDGRGSPGVRLRHGLVSYVTRVLYQETLFFLIPFYVYSMVFPSRNMFFVGLLGGMAVLSCLDLVFDRWIRKSPVFGLVFFATVTFAALNLLIPLLFHIPPAYAVPIAGCCAAATSAPLVIDRRSRPSLLRVTGAAATILVVAFWLQPLIPPVPLRLERVEFGVGFDETEMELTQPLGRIAELTNVNEKIVILGRIFAPANVPSRVVVEWTLDDDILKTSREVQITAHEGGFRIWDTYKPDDATLRPGLYRIALRTVEGALFGTASLRLR